MQKTHTAITRKKGALKKYQEVIVGSLSLFDFLYFEWCCFLSIIPGAIGLAARKIFWPRLFACCGKNTVFAQGVILRRPGSIRLGTSVVISEGCILDGRSDKEEFAITIGDNVILSNNVMLSCKDGSISIGNNVGVNAQTIIQSTHSCPVVIGDDTIIGQACFIVGGGNYTLGSIDTLTREQPIADDGGVMIKENVWLGGKVTVVGGVRIGQGAVVAAGAVMTRSVPEFSVCVGVPARVVKNRRDEDSSNRHS
ncbi:acyltransferase [Desulfogranum marinum]|uniref:acyltransferase n=1 Tax=Desulfogranum marinum TaxID=453220 RepID=UPI0029C911EA|nr:acyltransferase [Desulfogranum marinum]